MARDSDSDRPKGQSYEQAVKEADRQGVPLHKVLATGGKPVYTDSKKGK